VTPVTVYVASPVAAYGTPYRARALAAIRREVGPDAVAIDPAILFASNEDWLRTWPIVVRTLDALVIVPGADRTIGAGVLREVSDALAYGVPVSLWAPPGRLVPWARFDVRGIPNGSASMAAWVVPLDVPTSPTRQKANR